jgi:hypothetical protein
MQTHEQVRDLGDRPVHQITFGKEANVRVPMRLV